MKKILVILEEDKNIDIKNLLSSKVYNEYNWYIETTGENTEILYKYDIYNLKNESIQISDLNRLLLDEDYYVIHLIAQGYKKNLNSKYNMIGNKKDFLDCQCEILFRIFDSIFYQFVINDNEIAKHIYKNLKDNLDGIARIEYTDVNSTDRFLNF